MDRRLPFPDVGEQVADLRFAHAGAAERRHGRVFAPGADGLRNERVGGRLLEHRVGQRGSDQPLAVHSVASGAFLREQRSPAGGFTARRRGGQSHGRRRSPKVGHQCHHLGFAQAPGLGTPARHARAGTAFADVLRQALVVFRADEGRVSDARNEAREFLVPTAVQARIVAGGAIAVVERGAVRSGRMQSRVLLVDLVGRQILGGQIALAQRQHEDRERFHLRLGKRRHRHQASGNDAGGVAKVLREPVPIGLRSLEAGAHELVLGLEPLVIERRSQLPALAVELVAAVAALLFEQLHAEHEFLRRALGQRARIVARGAGGLGELRRQQRVVPEVVFRLGLFEVERGALALMAYRAAELFHAMDGEQLLGVHAVRIGLVRHPGIVDAQVARHAAVDGVQRRHHHLADLDRQVACRCARGIVFGLGQQDAAEHRLVPAPVRGDILTHRGGHQESDGHHRADHRDPLERTGWIA